MKILHINWSGNLGGAEKFVYNLAVAQKETDNDVTIAYMSKKSIIGTKADKSGLKTVEFNMRSGMDISDFIKYIQFIQEENYDIIHDHNGPPIVRLSKLFSPDSIFIQHIHGTKLGNIKWEKRTVILWKQLTYKLVNHWVANSNSTKNIASIKEKIPLSLISVIHNGIDLSQFKPSHNREKIRNELKIDKDNFVIGTVARLSPPKGIDKFVEIARFMQNEKAVKFVIVGDGELRSELERLVVSGNLTDKVIFTGSREDIPDILSAFETFLSTSNWEAFGIALVEAMAVGVPIVAFAINGVTEVIDKECGILIPYGETDKTVEALGFLKNNPEKRKQMGLEGIKKAKLFDIKAISSKILSLYSSLLHQHDFLR